MCSGASYVYTYKNKKGGEGTVRTAKITDRTYIISAINQVMNYRL